MKEMTIEREYHRSDFYINSSNLDVFVLLVVVVGGGGGKECAISENYTWSTSDLGKIDTQSPEIKLESLQSLSRI